MFINFYIKFYNFIALINCLNFIHAFLFYIDNKYCNEIIRCYNIKINIKYKI